MSYELRIEDIKHAKITLSLITINILVFIVANVILNDGAIYILAQRNRNIIEDNEIWRLFTAMFAHGSLQHLLSNCMALLFVGAYSEITYPKKGLYLLNYFVSGLMGNIFTLLIVDDSVYSLGASGAIAGLYGAHLYLMYKRNENFKFLGAVFLINFLYSSFLPGIGTWSHIFGLLSGILFGIYIYKREIRVV